MPHILQRYPQPNAIDVSVFSTINVQFNDVSLLSNCEIQINGGQIYGFTSAHNSTLSYAPRKYLQPGRVYTVEVVCRTVGTIDTWQFRTEQLKPVSIYISYKMRTKRVVIQREQVACLSELLAKASRKFNKEIIRVYHDEHYQCPLDDEDILSLDENITVYVL
jgi:hypothetical protein